MIRTFMMILGLGALLALPPYPAIAAATCLPGLPCETPLTASQLGLPHSGPNAAKSASQACNANFMNQIYGKAFLEAGRENVIANSTILKPDSVLEYTCFEKTSSRLAWLASFEDVLSEKSWKESVDIINGTVKINVHMGSKRLDEQIEYLVLESLKEYADTNFPYDFLAGTATGDNNTIKSTVAGSDPGGICDHMYNMYHLSKCENFGLNAPFMTFESYFSKPALNSVDPRIAPMTCPDPHGVTAARIAIAKNKNWTASAFPKTKTYLSKFDATDGKQCLNATPIPTGVMVKYVVYDQDLAGNPIVSTAPYEYQDKVCSNPACYFDNQGNADPKDDKCVP